MDSVTFTTRAILIGSLAVAIGLVRDAPTTGMVTSVVVGMLAIVLAGTFEMRERRALKVFCVLLAMTAVLVCMSIVPFELFFYARAAELRVVAEWRYGLFAICTILALVTWLLVGAGMKTRVRQFFIEMHWQVQEC